MLKLAVAFAAIAVPLQILAGDLHGLNVARAPAGEAGGDGRRTGTTSAPGKGVPLVLFALPERRRRNATITKSRCRASAA